MIDKIAIEFTREEALQTLLVITTLNTIEAIYAPGLCQKPDMVTEKFRSLQSFVEGNS
jgi:hypothetical protein